MSVSSDDTRFLGEKTGSPLSKRLKLSRDRQGQSGLKVEVFQDHSNVTSDADDDDEDDGDDGEQLGVGTEDDGLEDDNDLERRARVEEREEIEAGMRDATDDESESEDEDDDDDFLARDIEFG